MAKVTDQDQEHPLYSALDEWVESRGTGTTSRLRPRDRSTSPFSYFLWLWQNVLKFIVMAWRELSEPEKQAWRDICPPEYKSGYTYFIVWHLYAAGGCGPFTVKGTFGIGQCYIGAGPVKSTFTVGFSPIGGYAQIS